MYFFSSCFSDVEAVLSSLNHKQQKPVAGPEMPPAPKSSVSQIPSKSPGNQRSRTLKHNRVEQFLIKGSWRAMRGTDNWMSNIFCGRLHDTRIALNLAQANLVQHSIISLKMTKGDSRVLTSVMYRHALSCTCESLQDYVKLWNPDNRRLLGGIYLSHRLVTEAESVPGPHLERSIQT